MSTTKDNKSKSARAKNSVATATDAARRTASDLRRAGVEAIGDARSGIDDAVRRVGEVGRDVYLAGLGALATADDRRKTVWNDLVEQGEKVSKPYVEEPLREAGSRIKGFGSKLESTIEQRVQGGLERMGVPSRREIHHLTSRIEALNAKIDRLGA